MLMTNNEYKEQNVMLKRKNILFVSHDFCLLNSYIGTHYSNELRVAISALNFLYGPNFYTTGPQKLHTTMQDHHFDF